MKRKSRAKEQLTFETYFIIPLFLLFILSISFLHPGKIDLKLIKNERESYLQLKNTGNIILTGIDVYIDSNKYTSIETKLLPNKTIEDKITISPGKHIIIARTSEGAHNHLIVGG